MIRKINNFSSFLGRLPLGKSASVTTLLFTALIGCSVAANAPEYPTRARALKDPNSINFSDASPAQMRKLAKQGKFDIAQEVSLAVNLAGENADNNPKEPGNFTPEVQEKKVTVAVPARENLPGHIPNSSPNGELLPPGSKVPGGGGTASGSTMPGGGTAPGSTMPGGGTNPGHVTPPVQGNAKPGGEMLPPNQGSQQPGVQNPGVQNPGVQPHQPTGPITCQSLNLYITKKKDHAVIEGKAKGTLHRSHDKHNERLVAHVQLPNASKLQVRYYFGNAIDAISLTLSSEDLKRYTDSLTSVQSIKRGGSSDSDSQNENGGRGNREMSEQIRKENAEAKEYGMRAREAMKNAPDFIDFDHPVANLPKSTIDGVEGYYLDNNLLYPPQRAKFVDGRPEKIEIRGLDANGQAQGEKCEWKLKWKSPIVFDLHGMGQPETLSVFESDVKFDVAGDGVPVPTGWITPQYGFLALDLNNNGIIDGGEELFGEGTRLPNGKRANHGYEALAQFDVLRKGFLDKNSPIFSKLKMWVDKNSDGISTADEISSLSRYGITKISVNYSEIPRKNWKDRAGNLVKFESKFFGPSHCGEKGCGTYDVFFATMPVAAMK